MHLSLSFSLHLSRAELGAASRGFPEILDVFVVYLFGGLVYKSICSIRDTSINAILGSIM